MGRTHTLIGAAAGVLAITGDFPGVMVGVTIEPLIIGGIIGAAAGKLPDVIEGPLGVRHRHFTHSVWAVILLIVGVRIASTSYGIEPAYGYALVASYTAHILADALTVAGVHWLAPFRTKWRLRLLPVRIRTGGAVDSLAGAAAGVWLLWVAYQGWR